MTTMNELNMNKLHVNPFKMNMVKQPWKLVSCSQGNIIADSGRYALVDDTDLKFDIFPYHMRYEKINLDEEIDSTGNDGAGVDVMVEAVEKVNDEMDRFKVRIDGTTATFERVSKSMKKFTKKQNIFQKIINWILSLFKKERK